MVKTAKLALPYIEAAQAQKHVTHNEAIRALDALVQISVIANDQASPPSDAQEGDRYVVAPNGAGDWSGQDSKLAAWQDGAWAFYQPQTGWIAWVEDEAKLKVFDGNSWINLNTGGSEAIATELNPAPLIGVNSIADASNRLSVASPGSLFTHEGSDHRMIINKAAAEDTASMVFQTSHAGRAEFGLVGDDDFQFKVSNDGAIFTEAMRISVSSSEVTFKKVANMNGGGNMQIDRPANVYYPAFVVRNLDTTSQGYATISFSRPTADGGELLGTVGLNGLGNTAYGGENTLIIGAFLAAINLSFCSGNAVKFMYKYSNNIMETFVPFKLASYSVASLPSASAAGPGAQVFVSNATGGAVPAFSDGTSWRRVTDRSVIS